MLELWAEIWPDHRCKIKQLFFIKRDWSNNEKEVELEDSEEQLKKFPLEISMHAMTRSLSLQTMQVKAKLKKQSMTILIDSSSTHNFIHLDLVKRFNFRWSDDKPLESA